VSTRAALAAACAACGACGPAPAAPTIANHAAPGAPIARALHDLTVDDGAQARVVAAEVVASPADRAALAAAVAAMPEDSRIELRDDDGDGHPHFIDVDRDHRADLALVDNTFYGPSAGYHVFVRDGARYADAFADPGTFIGFEPVGDHVVLRFGVEILAGGEARVVRALDYDRARDEWPAAPTAFVGAQTEVPPIDPGATVTLAGATAVRTAPAIDDGAPAAPTPSDDGDDYAHSTVLRGNVVADYPAGARGLVLGARGDWLFVAMPAEPPPSAVSLRHGMFERYDQAADTMRSAPPPGATYCGWIPRASTR